MLDDESRFADQNFLRNPLSFPGLPKRNARHVALHVYVQPSFAPAASWSLFPTLKGEWFTRRIVEVYRLEPRKTGRDYFGSEAPLPSEVALSLLDQGSSLSISPPPQATSIGIDGITFGLVLNDGMMSAFEATWWCKPHAGYSQANAFLEDAINCMEQYLPASTHPLHGPPWTAAD